jgi:haloalkane dehalogenase
MDAERRGTAAGLAYREAGPGDGRVALLLHGYPESSYMWRPILSALARAGWRAIAPDLAGFGDSPPDRPGTWERHAERVAAFHAELDLGPVALVVHDWGGLIGLLWACEHPDAVRALVISCTGFFPDGKWHGLAQAMRTAGQGEQLMEGMTRDGLAAVLAQASAGFTDEAIDEYWKAFADDDRRQAQLELYRSGDFARHIGPHDGKLGGLGVPTLILWGADDPFAPVAGAHRFHKEIPGSRLVVIDGAGHFVVEDAPDRVADEIAGFLS